MLSNARAANRPSSSSSSSSSPFTATQWQELEHQALIYKYMVSGVPIPPELLFSVKRSLDSSLASIGWGCFQVGLGKKGDPEPGRCRRTDGKKWRCSKEAYPGSKYCDRHMHRGRNRSRKPVEISSSSSSPSPSTTPNTASRPSPPITSTTTTTSNSNYYHNPYLTTYNTSPSLINPLSISSSTSSLESEVHHQAPLNGQNILNTTFLYNSSNSSPCSKTTTTPNLLMDSLSSSSSHHHHHPASDKDYRYLQGVREDDQPLHHHQYGTSAQSELDNFYSYPSSKQDYHNQQQQQHCFVLGADFKSSSSSSMSAINNRALMKVEEGNSKSVKEMSSHKPMHHFFGVGGADSWLDLASSSRPS